MRAFKKTLVALLIVSFLAPGFYFGIAPPQEVEAQGIGMDTIMSTLVGGGLAVSACVFGHVINGALARAGDMIVDFITNIAPQWLGDIIGGISEFLGGSIP